MRVLEIFKLFVSIPRCSGNTSKMAQFIADWAKRTGYDLFVDEAGNILCRKTPAKIAFQSHYDMVCVGKAPQIELIRENNILRARDSSLGADNGIGVAVMLYLMEKGYRGEYIFTNDEEIGLLGAKKFNFELQSKVMLNLDSEEPGEIYVGCAGGVDIIGEMDISASQKGAKAFEIVSPRFPGGHSGVDIDKNIPNAIKELSLFLYEKGLEPIRFMGGERMNSIPASAKAVVLCDDPPSEDRFLIKEAGIFSPLSGSKEFFRALISFPTGLREWNREFDIPNGSVNLSLASLEEKGAKIALSARGMDEKTLRRLETESALFLESFGFSVRTEHRYPPWRPKYTDFGEKVASVCEKIVGGGRFKAIHAGLEAAIFANKYPSLEIVSIGPAISYPHSVRESLDLKTLSPFAALCEETAKLYQ